MVRDVAILTSNIKNLPECLTPRSPDDNLETGFLGRVGVIFYEGGLGPEIGSRWYNLTRQIHVVNVSQQTHWVEQPSPTVGAREASQTFIRHLAGNSIRHLLTVGYDRPLATLAPVLKGLADKPQQGLVSVSGLALSIGTEDCRSSREICFALDLTKILSSSTGIGELQLAEINHSGATEDILASSPIISVPGEDPDSLRGSFNRAAEEVLQAITA